jgi:hypothetical protein
MKIVFFNHHSDEMYWHIKTFEHLGHECHVATRKLTLESGEDYCSFNEHGKVQKGPVFYDWKELHPDMDLKFTDTIEGFDAAVTISGKIPYKLSSKMKVFACVVVKYDINKFNDLKNVVKIIAHPDAKQWNGHFVPKFVPKYGKIGKLTYVSQLMERYYTKYLNELIMLKMAGYPVIIAGAKEAPDGVVKDLSLLEETRFLVHDKEYGISCGAVLKALDSGCKVYISKKNRVEIGLQDIPDDCFIFSDNISIKDAFHKNDSYDKTKIQQLFREVRSLENAAKHLESVLSDGTISG